MSQYLDNMAIGDSIDFRGPNGLLVYEGNGMMHGFVQRKKEKIVKTLLSLYTAHVYTFALPLVNSRCRCDTV